MAASKQVGYFRFELLGQPLTHPNLNSGPFLWIVQVQCS